MKRTLTKTASDAVRAILEGTTKKTRPRKYDVMDVFATIVYLLDKDLPFREIPEGSPPWRSCHEMYLVWTRDLGDEQTCLERALRTAGLTALVVKLHQRLNNNRRA